MQFSAPLVLIAEAERSVPSSAFPLWFALIARLGAARAALVTYASPVVAVALGIVLLDEELTPLAPVGLALILAGSWLASRATAASARQRPRTAQPTPRGGRHAATPTPT